MRRLGWQSALLAGTCATLIVLILEIATRGLWQVRTLPERVMEWLLLFIPLDVFEHLLAVLGTDAKGYALIGITIGMSVVLVGIGAMVARSRMHRYVVLALGPALWLIAMLIVLPLTGAGAFGSGGVVSPGLTALSYLLVFTGYATTLEATRWILGASGRRVRRRDVAAERRALLSGLAATVGAGVLARLVAPDGGQIQSDLPLAEAPVAALESTPMALPTAPAASPSATSVVVATLQPTAGGRELAREKDGVLVAAGRTPGRLASLITRTADFYVVSKNPVADPTLDSTAWRLVVDGEVARPVQVDYATLRALPAVDIVKTLECISNLTANCEITRFGCDLISTAHWRGARVRDVLALAGGINSRATDLVCVSADEFSAAIPAGLADDPEALLVYEMNGAPLPHEHGFPVRLLVPGRYGMKNPKWLVHLRAVAQHEADWYEQRNWNRDGVVQTMSRIDVPAGGSVVPAGRQTLAGIAYAGDRGPVRVEFSQDGGASWHPTDLLEPMAGRDALVRWASTIDLAPGRRVTFTVRAIDGTGEVQTDVFRLPQPDGGTGRHTISVSVLEPTASSRP